MNCETNYLFTYNVQLFIKPTQNVVSTLKGNHKKNKHVMENVN